MVRATLSVLVALGASACWILLLAAAAHLLRSAAFTFGRPLPNGDALPDDQCPLLTVQLPLRNEPATAERVLRAACALDWPRERLEVQALDDSDDQTSAILDRVAAELRAAGHDVKVLRRGSSAGHKAGNLAHGLASARGELVAVLDADSVPPRDFLRRLAAPLCADETLAFAQARWSYDNERANLLTRVQSLILDGLMVVEQARLSALSRPLAFNGTGGLWRRSALDAAGGWLGAAATASVTEDLDLSYRARLAGYRGRQVEELAVETELPVAMAAFVAQQERWVRGAGQVLRALARRLGGGGTFTMLGHLLRHGRQPLLVALILWLPATGLGWLAPAWTVPYAWPSVLAVVYLAVSIYYAAARARLGRSPLVAFALAPAVIVLSIGLSLPLAVSFWRGLFDARPAAWVRTPKRGGAQAEVERAPRRPLAFVEAAIGLGYLVLVGLAAARADWLTASGFAIIAAGYLWVGLGSLFN